MSRIFSRFTFLTLLVTNTVFSQQLYEPVNIQRAYENKTRTKDGYPGENYFQNKASYTIDVEVNPAKKLLKGKENIVYHNLSQDTVTTIRLNIYQEYLRKGNMRDGAISPENITDGVIIDKISIDNKSYIEQTEYWSKNPGTSRELILKRQLLPNDSIVLDINWSFNLPSSHVHRFGCYHNTSFFIAYWYPHIAVYDDIDGWDQIQHTGMCEFYGDYNNYEVTISVPGNYTVWATGLWENPAEILKMHYLKRYDKALESGEVVNIFKQGDRELIHPFLSKKENAWKFKAENVTDFAFAISDNYLWDAVSVKPDSLTDRKVLMNAVYHETATDFYKVAELGKDIISELSVLTGITYPYPRMTVFNGEGGMEYPMMVNESAMFDWGSTAFVTTHEICHSYLPFMVGINEKKYAWIDEGIVTYLPKPVEYNHGSTYYNIAFIMDAVNHALEHYSNTPLTTYSYSLDPDTYTYNSYIRSAMSFYLLHNYLGDSLFYGGIHNFLQTWKSKHPTPYDLFYCFNNYTGKDLNWFWDKYFFSRECPDLKIENVQLEEEKVIITINNIGGLPVPVWLKIFYEDKSADEHTYSMDVWKNNEQTLRIELNTTKDIQYITLGDEKIPDINDSDNVMNSKDFN